MKKGLLLFVLLLCLTSAAQAAETLSPLRLAELSIRDAPVEHMIVLDPTGKVLGESVGTFDTVKEPNVQLSGNIVLHNHIATQSFYFSVSDVHFAAINNAQTMVVVNPVTVDSVHMYMECTIQRGARERWPNKEIWSAADVDDPLGFTVLERDFHKSNPHAMWTKYFEHYGLDYSCQVLP